MHDPLFPAARDAVLLPVDELGLVLLAEMRRRDKLVQRDHLFRELAKRAGESVPSESAYKESDESVEPHLLQALAEAFQRLKNKALSHRVLRAWRRA